MIIIKMPVGRLRAQKLFELTEDFVFWSTLIRKNTTIPKGFICDFESVPFLRGTCRTAGLIHDYLCRIDSVPVVTKKEAALIYKEALQYYKQPWWKVYVKYLTVRIAKGYFHKRKTIWQ